jgi:hypothetical protein
VREADAGGPDAAQERAFIVRAPAPRSARSFLRAEPGPPGPLRLAEQAPARAPRRRPKRTKRERVAEHRMARLLWSRAVSELASAAFDLAPRGRGTASGAAGLGWLPGIGRARDGFRPRNRTSWPKPRRRTSYRAARYRLICGYFAMATPGLEPGTPRFSGTRYRPVEGGDLQGVCVARRRSDACSFVRFPAGLGHGCGARGLNGRGQGLGPTTSWVRSSRPARRNSMGCPQYQCVSDRRAQDGVRADCRR